MDFEAQEQGEVDEIMAPREDLLGYDDEELAEDDIDVHSVLHEGQTQQAADEEEANFRCVTKTAVLAAWNTTLHRHGLHQTGCSDSNSNLRDCSAEPTAHASNQPAEHLLQQLHSHLRHCLLPTNVPADKLLTHSARCARDRQSSFVLAS